MNDIWVISDTHFGHKNIIEYCNRPFKSVSEMDEEMIERWNSVVKPQDKVYHLGDVFFGEATGQYILPKLNGKKRLILGNHDDAKSKTIQKYFEKIYLFRCFKEFGLMLTHVPVQEGSIKWIDNGGINVHGHIHDKKVQWEVHNWIDENVEIDDDPRYKCVCVEHTNYTPVNIEDLRVRFPS